jgi:hypothetical protein
VIIVVPDVTPDTTPVDILTVATAVLLLDHVPPRGEEDKVEVPLGQVFVTPVMPPKPVETENVLTAAAVPQAPVT